MPGSAMCWNLVMARYAYDRRTPHRRSAVRSPTVRGGQLPRSLTAPPRRTGCFLERSIRLRWRSPPHPWRYKLNASARCRAGFNAVSAGEADPQRVLTARAGKNFPPMQTSVVWTSHGTGD
ncbi:hypothetical protein KCP78_25690 [Salmonella enterica subsp. enterica]|nr:hypothetical protein KCP78_25690 [Salmonella enterica subsp. enterica]